MSRIKSNTSKILRQTFAQLGEGPTTLTHSGLEKALADLLLPPDGFGHRSNSSGRTGSHGGQETSHSGRSPILQVTETGYRDNLIDISFNFRSGKGTKKVLLELQVVTEAGAISANKWERPSTIGTSFPLVLTEFRFGEVILDSNNLRDTITTGAVSVSCAYSENYDVPYGIKIVDVGEESMSFEGKLTFERASRDISGALSITQAQKGGEEE